MIKTYYWTSGSGLMKTTTGNPEHITKMDVCMSKYAKKDDKGVPLKKILNKRAEIDEKITGDDKEYTTLTSPLNRLLNRATDIKELEDVAQKEESITI